MLIITWSGLGLSQEAWVMKEAGNNDAMIYGIYRKLATDYSNHTKQVIQPLPLPQWLPNGCSIKKRRWEKKLEHFISSVLLDFIVPHFWWTVVYLRWCPTKKNTLATFWQWEKQYEGEGVAGLVTSWWSVRWCICNGEGVAEKCTYLFSAHVLNSYNSGSGGTLSPHITGSLQWHNYIITPPLCQ